MPVSFPISKQYFVSFRNSDTGLVPTFSYYKNAVTLANITPQPTFTELSNGTYYFSVPFASSTDPDIIFQIDGGASIPTEEIRYQTSMVSPKDLFIDEPTSQVVSDVWTNSTAYSAGQKGKRVDDLGVPAAASIAADIANIRGADSRDLTQLAGTGVFVPGTDNLHEIAIDAAAAAVASPPSTSAIANAVWDAVLASHLTAGSTGAKLNSSGGLDATQTAAAVWNALTASYQAINSFGARSKTDSENIQRSLGMLHENSVLDQTTYTVDNNLQTGRLRIYDSKANADAAAAASPATYDTGKIAEYAIVATYTGSNLTTYKMSKE